MREARNKLGFIVLEEGRPVRDSGSKAPEYRFVNWDHSHYPVAVFDSRLMAESVKRLLRRRHCQTANSFDLATEDGRRCFDLWTKRAQSIRISCAQKVTIAKGELQPSRSANLVADISVSMRQTEKRA